MLRFLALGVTFFALAAASCGGTRGEEIAFDESAAVTRADADAAPPRRPVTMCLTGACPGIGGNCPSNRDFAAICDELGRRSVGLVKSGADSTFVTAFAS